jgi:hypothetical protein
MSIDEMTRVFQWVIHVAWHNVTHHKVTNYEPQYNQISCCGYVVFPTVVTFFV